jgi:cytochrome b561
MTIFGSDQRYARAAIILHWLIALLIVIQVFLGWWLNEWVPDHSPIQDKITGVHISVGLTILLLVLARIVLRLVHRPPPPPAGTRPWERILASFTHLLFYALMLVLPLSGWAMVSMGHHPIHFWGLPWPHLPGVGRVFGSPAPKGVHKALMHVHVFILIWILVLTFALHVAAALWHQFAGRPILPRMWLGRRRR